MTAPSCPELEQLLGGYFHEDFDLEGGTPEGVVQRYLIESNAHDHAQLIDELDRLLTASLSEQELRTLVHDTWYSSYEPGADGLTMREWLESVRRAVHEWS